MSSPPKRDTRGIVAAPREARHVEAGFAHRPLIAGDAVIQARVARRADDADPAMTEIDQKPCRGMARLLMREADIDVDRRSWRVPSSERPECRCA